MAKLAQIQKAFDGDHVSDSMYTRQDSAPDKVMFNMQGPLHLDRPLKIGETDAAPEHNTRNRAQSMQNDTQGGK